MKFPDRSSLQRIVEAHYGVDISEAKSSLKSGFDGVFANAAIDKFIGLRNAGNLFKNPGTSEFLDWLDAMMEFGKADTLLPSLRSLDSKQLPFREVLFKVQKDWQQFQPLAGEA